MQDARPLPPSCGIALAAVIAASFAAAGCSTAKQAVYERESFGTSSTFSRAFPATGDRTCDAARRALLSQGYIVDTAKADLVQAHKNFQPSGDTHVQLSFSVVCVPDPAAVAGQLGQTTAFVNAVQDRYALKKTNNAATLGVSVLGTVSLPLPAGDDSMVKVASETVSSPDFYARWFALLDRYLAGTAPREVPPLLPPPLPASPPSPPSAQPSTPSPDSAASSPVR